MTDYLATPADNLNRRFFLDYPSDVAKKIEELPAAEVIDAVTRQPVKVLIPAILKITPDTASRLLRALPDSMADELLTELPPPAAVRVLGHLSQEERAERLVRLDDTIRRDLETIMSYPRDTAGRIMDTSVWTFRRDAKVADALKRLRKGGMTTARSLFLVDDNLRLTGKVSLQDAALAPEDAVLGSMETPIVAVVRPIDSLSIVAQLFENRDVLDIAVVDLDGIFLGAVTHTDIAKTVQQNATAGLQTMVGASKEERALSSPFFTVKKRMPWLQINLLTAFLAASVVGIFEATIAQVTALAVLLPVVAGQSGNTGAQALAVTMRGLALREITVRQWARVVRKEVIAGFLNGVAIAITCGIGVFIWSQSIGLVAVIMSSMVIAMIAAGFTGALIPVLLTRLGQDPATSSSIILTTVTDVAGFFAFLGIASLMMQFLQ
ncbi:magnesium transporter [Sneathiella sp.]|jgi:magnesium transporter|uniref:magnesium transporter n=1 Tax=Sneathiella sp. TaxID=1964365 RepID=UPI0039E453A9